jgi:hypothetical protein
MIGFLNGCILLPIHGYSRLYPFRETQVVQPILSHGHSFIPAGA